LIYSTKIFINFGTSKYDILVMLNLSPIQSSSATPCFLLMSVQTKSEALPSLVPSVFAYPQIILDHSVFDAVHLGPVLQPHVLLRLIPCAL